MISQNINQMGDILETTYYEGFEKVDKTKEFCNIEEIKRAFMETNGNDKVKKAQEKIAKKFNNQLDDNSFESLSVFELNVHALLSLGIDTTGFKTNRKKEYIDAIRS